ncbi:MAG: UDP-N-acetylmuramoyl-tripeptide--D-alanyl-D-alanine ligase [Rhodocyclales bacterium]|nr:UDP-N-acetylmuramoyl-tripeptide--D-alanyl-D-alanine ligase [Rhodocyclales bacterium]
MMPGMMQLSEAAQACDGQLTGTDIAFETVGTDTRADLSGALYVALRGERFDGHAFIAEAAQAGAVAALVDRRAHFVAPTGFPLISVEDTRLALGTLGHHWRSKFDIPVIGVTGSNGKTTVKEMCAAILSAWALSLGLDPATAILATQGNLNNDIGLPQMLLRLRSTHKAAVFEMGMNHPGEIAYLAGLAEPTVALVNNAQRAHLEGMGEVFAVAREKGQIYGALDESGVAIVNADDVHADYWRDLNAARRIITFGLRSDADVAAAHTQLAFGSRVQLTAFGEQREFQLSVPGQHNVRNAAAAAAATLAAGVPLDVVVAGLAGYSGTKGRLQVRRTTEGAVVLDDTYNANPDSVRAGIDVLAATPGGKVLVLGDMGEIGDISAQCHDEIGGYAKSQGIDRLLALGEHSAVAVRNFGSGGEHFENLEDLVSALRAMLAPDIVVLVKGSRFMKMERVVLAIAENIAENEK